MAKGNGVSSKTHNQNQLDDYANQHNPNNKAYFANKQNQKAMRKKTRKAPPVDNYVAAEWPYDGDPDEF